MRTQAVGRPSCSYPQQPPPPRPAAAPGGARLSPRPRPGFSACLCSRPPRRPCIEIIPPLGARGLFHEPIEFRPAQAQRPPPPRAARPCAQRGPSCSAPLPSPQMPLPGRLAPVRGRLRRALDNACLHACARARVHHTCMYTHPPLGDPTRGAGSCSQPLPLAVLARADPCHPYTLLRHPYKPAPARTAELKSRLALAGGFAMLCMQPRRRRDGARSSRAMCGLALLAASHAARARRPAARPSRPAASPIRGRPLPLDRAAQQSCGRIAGRAVGPRSNQAKLCGGCTGAGSLLAGGRPGLHPQPHCEHAAPPTLSPIKPPPP